MADRVIRDPVFDYVILHPELAPIVDHPLFQRLRRISQTSLTSSVYPSATGSRFEHSLGVMYLAERAWLAAFNNSSEETRNAFIDELELHVPGLVGLARAIVVRLLPLAVSAVGLLHDIGHTPFSHALEDQFSDNAYRIFDRETLDARADDQGRFHEFAGRQLLEFVLGEVDNALAALIRAIYQADEESPSALGTLHGIVAGQLDVDRLDYLMRDGKRMGIEFGAIDYQRLVDAFELHPGSPIGFVVAPGLRARSAAETFLVQRSQTYRWVVYHPRVVGANLALARALEGALDLAHVPDPEVADRFRSLIPNLNYIRPLGLLGEVTGDTSSLDDLAAERQSRDLANFTRAAVDDATVVDWLKRSGILAQETLARLPLEHEMRTAFLRHLAYVEAALFRKKNFVPVWKTFEEYEGMAGAMQATLRQAIREGYEEAMDRAGSEEMREALADAGNAADEVIASHAIRGMNFVFGHLLPDTGALLPQFRDQLNSAVPDLGGIRGFWELRYSDFAPLKTGPGSPLGLYEGGRFGEEGRIVALRESSPLVMALEEVEAQRPKVFAYYFFEHPSDFLNLKSEYVRDRRRQLAATFVEVAVPWIRAVWPSYLLPRG